MALQALFYPASFASLQVADLVRGRDVEALDIVDFPDEKGGSVDQQLAVPFLSGMDEIVVEEARIALRTAAKDLDIEDYRVAENRNLGVFLALPAPARLKKIEISYTLPGNVDKSKVRLVLRSATPSGSGFDEGVPLFAHPHFGQAGPMYGLVLGGMNVSDLGDDRQLIRLPGVLGSAWLIQLATGKKPDELEPLQVRPKITRVTLDATPRNLSVLLASGAEEIKLWNNPEALLPEAGEQEVSFTPLAQRHLAHALKSAPASAVTLPVPLRFVSDSGGAIQITKKSLKSDYIVRPLGEAPITLRLGGEFVPVTLSAAAALRPKSSAMRLTAKLLGRELNAGSPEPGIAIPSTGLRFGPTRAAATAVDVAPLAGKGAGSLLDLASARVYVAARETTEVVLEVRADLAASPGPVVSQPAVKQIDGGFSGWVEFEFAKPLTVVAGQAPVWVALRVNKGELFWFDTIGPADKGRISSDRGQTWSGPDTLLTHAGSLLVQLFHKPEGRLLPPIIRLRKGGTIVMTNLLAEPSETSAGEYQQANISLPAAILDALGHTTGSARTSLRLDLFSRSALDLVIDNLTFSYDPFQRGGGG